MNDSDFRSCILNNMYWVFFMLKMTNSFSMWNTELIWVLFLFFYISKSHDNACMKLFLKYWTCIKLNLCKRFTNTMRKVYGKMGFFHRCDQIDKHKQAAKENNITLNKFWLTNICPLSNSYAIHTELIILVSTMFTLILYKSVILKRYADNLTSLPLIY